MAKNPKIPVPKPTTVKKNVTPAKPATKSIAPKVTPAPKKNVTPKPAKVAKVPAWPQKGEKGKKQ